MSTAPRWSNWAGTATCRPAEIRSVRGEDELASAVRDAAAAGRTVKVAGTGHSFTDIACTDGLMLRLDRHDRVLNLDQRARTVTVEAGTTLAALSDRLAGEGLALSNMGDIGYQTVAGALATGTHGTGATFGNLSSQLTGVRLVTANGEVVECSASEDPELFRAARVSLGALGVVSAVTIQCEPAFNLHAVEGPASFDEVLERFDELVASNEHFECYWFPHTRRAMTKENNRTDRPVRPKSRRRTYLDDIFVANTVFGAVSRTSRRFPSLTPRLAQIVNVGLSRTEEVDRSDRVFTSPRLVRFAEMEYALPRASVVPAVKEVRSLIERRGFLVSFPIEVRVSAADDAYLSMSNGRDSGYVAVHMFQGVEFEPYFRAVEQVMRELDGRPHWGKLHFRTFADLEPAYPDWARFAAVRDRVDPDRVFTNDYLRRVLGS